MRRPAAFAISAMLAGTMFVAAAPLAFADDGKDHGDHDRCTAGMACGTARPAADEHGEHTAPATPAARSTAKPDDRDADVDENEIDVDENAVDENEDNAVDRDEQAGATPTASPTETPEPTETAEPAMTATPTPTATPTATASPGANTGGVDFAALQQLIAMIRDFFTSVAASLASLGHG